ncbi:MAG: hypothetical protein ACFE8P_13470 [Promethearchaeota archaeon]
MIFNNKNTKELKNVIDSNQRTKILMWILIIIVATTLVIMDAMFIKEMWWVVISVLLLVIVGCTVSFSHYFFIPKKHCPRCNTEVPSQYTQNCPKCGLKLVTKCLDCGKYITVYQGGKPSK